MRFMLSETPIPDTSCDLLALPVPEPGTLDGDAAEADRTVGGLLAGAARDDGFTGKRGRTLLLHTPEAPFRRVLLVGIGRDVNPESFRRYAGVALRRAGDLRAARVALAARAGGALAEAPAEERVRAVIEGAGLGAYRFDRYRKAYEGTEPGDVAVLVRGAEIDGVPSLAKARPADAPRIPTAVMSLSATSRLSMGLAFPARPMYTIRPAGSTYRRASAGTAASPVQSITPS